MLHLCSKIPMDIEKNLFAKDHLTASVRMTTALRLTQKNFGISGVTVVIMALTDGLSESKKKLTHDQQCALVGISISDEKRYAMRKFFVTIYHDDEILIGYLNKEITRRSVKYYAKNVRYNNDEAQEMAKLIFQRDMLEGLDLSF